MPDDGPQGLAVSSDGYTLVPSKTSVVPGARSRFTFTVTDKDGRPVTTYDTLHDKELHLIVVRRDLVGYQHLHPTRSADGRWGVPLTVPSGGVYKAFANFQPAGLPMPMPITLAVDLMASGTFNAVPLPAAKTTATVDGLKIVLSGQVVVGASELTFTVTRSGKPVELQPYLAAYGHLVALRLGDLAFLHVHPEETPGNRASAGNRVSFLAPVPTAGRYRLFFDFKTGDVVRTAEFTVTAPQGPPPPHRPPPHHVTVLA